MCGLCHTPILEASLNVVSTFDTYPMPRIKALLHQVGQAHYWSTLDLEKGYCQIPLRECNKEKTVFPSPSGLYNFPKMHIGLHEAATPFQRLMDRVLQLVAAFALAYIDDVTVFSHIWEYRLARLHAVLLQLREYGLTANPNKCHIGRVQDNNLGYVVGWGQLCEPIPDKVQSPQQA